MNSFFDDVFRQYNAMLESNQWPGISNDILYSYSWVKTATQSVYSLLLPTVALEVTLNTAQQQIAMEAFISVYGKREKDIPNKLSFHPPARGSADFWCPRFIGADQLGYSGFIDLPL